MRFSTDGLILKEQNIGEKDRLVTVLTKSHGVITAFVRGAKNIKNSKCASTSLLCYSRLDIYEGRDSYIIDDAKSTEMFVRLRSNVENMSLAQYFCEIAIHLFPREQDCSEFLRLILNSLYLLSNEKREPLLIKACFEMRVMCMCGYMPDLVMCSSCGEYEQEQMGFLPKQGKLICGSCLAKKPNHEAVIMSVGVTTALRHTVFAEAERLFSFTLSKQGLILLNQITESYIANHTEKDFPTLAFYKAISWE